MPDTTARVLRLLSLLQSRPVWTSTELAERLGVTTRSVRRDVERLRTLGYPVNAAPGVGGGYRLGAGRALPPLLLDDEEAVAVTVSLQLAGPAAGSSAGAGEAASRTLAKLDQVLPPRLRSEVRALREATDTLPGSAVEVDGDLLMCLARACRDLVRVRFGYTTRGDARGERLVEPHRLVATGRRWYLLAWDVDRDAWRVFRLDRVTPGTTRTTTWRFARRQHPDPAGHVQRAVASSAYRLQARVQVFAPAERVRSLVGATSAVVTALDDRSCLLEAGADSADALAVHLGWFGFEFRVLEPTELAEACQRLGERLLAAARADGFRVISECDGA